MLTACTLHSVLFHNPRVQCRHGPHKRAPPAVTTGPQERDPFGLGAVAPGDTYPPRSVLSVPTETFDDRWCTVATALACCLKPLEVGVLLFRLRLHVCYLAAANVRQGALELRYRHPLCEEIAGILRVGHVHDGDLTG